MTAISAAAPRTPSFLPHRYSDSLLPTSRNAESSQPSSHISSSPSTTIKAAGTPRTTLAMSSPPSAQSGALALPRKSSQGDANIDPSSSGVKYACASCIRGHRTSSCTHKDGSKGPLYPIRSKGRPPTQCEICRKKRKESGRHVRCDCTGKKPSTAVASSQPLNRSLSATSHAPILPYTADVASSNDANDPTGTSRPLKRTKVRADAESMHTAPTSSMRRASDDALPPSPTSSAFDNVLAPIRPPRGHHSWSLPSIHSAQSSIHSSDSRHQLPNDAEELAPRRYSTLSLSSLMNPCGCRSAGSCTCCSDQRQRRVPVSPKQRDSTLANCVPSHCSCSGPSCRNAKRASPVSEQPTLQLKQNDAMPTKPATSSCCSTKTASASTAPSIELLLRAVDMSTEFIPPPCGCGENCQCARCLAKQDDAAVTTHTSQQRTGAPRALSAMTASSVSPRTPPAMIDSRTQPAPTSSFDGPGCDDCAACDLALERPSGIGAVDSWMEKQRRQHPSTTTTSSPPPLASASSLSTHPRASSVESTGTAFTLASRRLSSQPVAETLSPPATSTASVPVSSFSVPPTTLHGGLLTSEPTSANSNDTKGNTSRQEGGDQVRAELVLIHPKCSACLVVVKTKGVGVLSSVALSI